MRWNVAFTSVLITVCTEMVAMDAKSDIHVHALCLCSHCMFHVIHIHIPCFAFACSHLSMCWGAGITLHLVLDLSDSAGCLVFLSSISKTHDLLLLSLLFPFLAELWDSLLAPVSAVSCQSLWAYFCPSVYYLYANFFLFCLTFQT